MGPIVVKDTEVYKWAEDWTSLNYCGPVKKACDATGTSPFLHNIHGTKLPSAVSRSFPDQQYFYVYNKGETHDKLLGRNNNSYVIQQDGLLSAQAVPDESVGRKLFTAKQLRENEYQVTILEPLCTGIFKSSIRDDSKYTGKKSSIIAHDDMWHLRFNIRNDLLKALFEVYHGVTDFSEKDYPRYSITTVDVNNAYLHTTYAKPKLSIPRHMKYAWPRFRCFSK